MTKYCTDHSYINAAYLNYLFYCDNLLFEGVVSLLGVLTEKIKPWYNQEHAYSITFMTKKNVAIVSP